jgi:hypothetical protein
VRSYHATFRSKLCCIYAARFAKHICRSHLLERWRTTWYKLSHWLTPRRRKSDCIISLMIYLSTQTLCFIKKLLRRSMIKKYSSKNIDDKKLIFSKFNLIYWSEYWLFDALQLTSIEIYLYSTIYEMNNFDVELDSYLNRFHVVRWISRNEILRESFNKTFVLRSFAHFVTRSLKVWAWSLNRWVRLIED